MAFKYFSTVVINPGFSGALATGDTLFVDRTGSLIDTTIFPVIFFGGGGGTIINRGTIAGVTAGVVGDYGTSLRVVHNAADGLISGADGINLSGQGMRLTNDGEVVGGNTGIRGAGASNTVTNSGTIRGGNAGILFDDTGGYGDDGSVVHNAGTITGGDFAVRVTGRYSTVSNDGLIAVTDGFSVAVSFGDVGANLTNTGTIRGGTAVSFTGPAAFDSNILRNAGSIIAGDRSTDHAILGSETRETVINTGTITGDTRLGGAGDIFDGTEGRQGAVSGGAGADVLLGGAGADVLHGDADADSLVGGAGDDVLTGGAGADTLEGGDGRDMLDYRDATTGVEVSLLLGTGSGGDAAGDVFSGFEWLGGGGYADTLTGDNTDNRILGGFGDDLLSGAGGADTLAGGFGADFLIGGAGGDVLTGGFDHDRFRYLKTADSAGSARDVITDFAAGDRLDLVAVDANAVGGTANDAFAFIGSAAFTAAGQVRALVIGDNTYVYANTDANLATSEMVIVLRGAIALAATDFIL